MLKFTPVSEIYRRFKLKEQLMDWFDPLPYQRESFLAKEQIQLIEGGNRSGKTHLVCAKICQIIMGIHPTIKRPSPMKVRIIATVLNEGTLGVILEKLKWLLPTVYLKGGSWANAHRIADNRVDLRDGSTIQLMSNSQDIQTHRGDSIDIAWMDEEPDEKIYDETLTRLADRAGILMLSMTPHNGMTWSYKRLVKASRYDKNIGYYHLDTLSNYMINRKNWIQISATMSQKEFDIRVKGLRVANEGLVYAGFNDRTHVIQPFTLPEGSQLFMGVDFGLNNPHAGSLWAITPSQKKYVIDEYYETGLTVKQNGEAMGTWLRNKWGNFKIRWISVDPQSGYQRNEQTNETNMHVFTRALASTYGRMLPVVPGDKKKGCVEHRINVMRDLLTLQNSGLPDLMFFSTCVHHMQEFEEYVWQNRKDENLNQFERPKMAHNHLMNAAEYVAERNPKFFNIIERRLDFSTQTRELQYGSIGR